jgi:hypothetical protein
VLRKACGLKRDEITVGWRNLLNEELRNLHSSPNKIRIMNSRRIRWTGHVARMVEKRIAYRIWVRKPKGKILLGRHRRKWNFKNFIF